MKTLKFTIGKPIFTLIMMCLLIIAGLLAFRALRIETTPEVNTPVIYVAVPLPGAAPEEIESQITLPIEKKIAEIDDVENMKSMAWENVGITVVFFKETVNPKTKFKEFREKINEVRPLLPKEAMEPRIEEISFENLPMMFVGVPGRGRDRNQIGRYAADMKEKLETVNGVKRVVVTGAQSERVEVRISEHGLRSYGPSLVKLLTENLSKINTNMPGGGISLFDREYNVRTVGRFDTVDDLAGLVVGKDEDGEPVTLADVASVEKTFPPPITHVRVNGRNGVSLAIMKKSGYGTLDVSSAVKRVLKQYPDAVVMSDAGETVRNQMGELFNHALYGIALVIVVLFVTLGLRTAIIVSLAIPMSIFITFMAMAGKNMTLDIVSLFAMLLALGMIVDNSIVVCENIVRHIAEGRDPAHAALEATAEVGWPILSSTGAVVAAFLPMGIFLTGPIGEFTRPIPIVVTFTLISSLIVAVIFNPTLCRVLLRAAPGGAEKSDGPLLSFFKNAYERVISWCMDHSRLVITAAVLLFAGCLMLVILRVVGMQLFPQLDTARFYIDVRLKPGATLEQTGATVKSIEKILNESGWVNNSISNIGTSGVRVEIDDEIDFGPHIARIIVDLKPMTEINKRHKEVLQTLRQRMKKLTGNGTEIVFLEKSLGPPVGAPINIQVTGHDYKRIKKITREITNRLDRDKGVVDLEDNLPVAVPQIVLRPNHRVLSEHGLTTYDLGGLVFLSLTGHEFGEIPIGNESYPLYVKIDANLSAGMMPNFGGFMGFGGQREKPKIKLPDGASVAISDLISYELGEGVSGIDREDGQRTVTITAGTAPGVEAERIINRLKSQLPGVQKRLAKKDPAMRGTEVKFAGETLFIKRAMRNLTIAMLVSIVLIYFILLLEFRSTTQPLIILICVPYALVGVILGLLIMNYPFSILAGIGLLCLIGIVVNNGIIYIDYANLLQKRGMELRAACIEACRTRMRPIILTKATVILGIVPLAVASASKTQFWKPLCWAVIWGLIIATTLTLIIIPVAYYVMEKARTRFYAIHPPLEVDGD